MRAAGGQCAVAARIAHSAMDAARHTRYDVTGWPWSELERRRHDMGSPRAPNDDAPLSIEEFARLPEDPLYLYELVDGRLVREPRPANDHGWLVIKLGHYLMQFVEERRSGFVTTESGYVLQPSRATVRGPDVAYVRRERAPDFPLGGYPRIAPDLVAEVLSPSDRRHAMALKVAEYLDAGVRVVWLVDPRQQTVTVHRPEAAPRVLGIDDELDGHDALPEFRLPLAKLFSV
jgi:Uma2 family endonuclease